MKADRRSRAKARLTAANAQMSDRLWAKAKRKVALLSGGVPLWEMTQAEVDWVFRQTVRAAGD